MIISYKLLNKFVNLEKTSPQDIVNCFNNLGLEAEIYQNYQSLSNQLIVAEIIKQQRHPQLNKLWICTADVKTEQLIIVCGANNFKVGDKVILAPVGIKLNSDWKIKTRKFGNFISQGMFCSWKELGITNKKDEGIAVLPQDAKNGENNPLQYIEYDDCLFKVEIPWQEKELGNAFVLSRYLSQILKIKSKKMNWEQKNDINILQKEPKKEAQLTIETTLHYQQIISTPLSIRSSLELHQIQPSNNLLKDLVTYVALEIGFHLSITNNTKKSNNQQNFNLVTKLTKSSNLQKLPLILANYAHQRFLQLVQKLNPKGKIINKKFSFLPKIQETIISLDYINQVLGTSLQSEEIIYLFQNSDFQVSKQVNNEQIQIKFIVPNYRWFKNKNQIISEIVRWWGCKKVVAQKLTIQQMEWKKNNLLILENKIENYMFHLGIEQVKNFTLGKKENLSDKKTIQIKGTRENTYLQSSLITHLQQIQSQGKGFFTIDKIFYQQEKQFIEKKHLGVIFNQKWLIHPINQQKINIDWLFLVQIVKNILQIFALPTKNLWKKHFLHDKQELVLIKNSTINSLFPYQGYEVLFYQKELIGKIGIIKSEKNNLLHFYLELDLTTLIAISKKGQKPKKFIVKKKEKQFYCDFSLQFKNPFETKIYCPINDNQVVECNHYDHLIKSIYSLDKQISKIELIDQYQKQTLTFRIWKKQNEKNPESKKEMFKNLEFQIKKIENVKIV